MRISLRIEDKEGYCEKLLSQKELCALFDLRFMLDKGTWDMIKLNKMSKEISSLFEKVSHIDDASHKNIVGFFENGKIIYREKKAKECHFGKAKWHKKQEKGQ